MRLARKGGELLAIGATCSALGHSPKGSSPATSTALACRVETGCPAAIQTFGNRLFPQACRFDDRVPALVLFFHVAAKLGGRASMGFHGLRLERRLHLV